MKIKDGKVIMTAIIGIVILDSIALLNGIDGVLLMTALAAIAGLAGWTIPSPKFIKQ
jgi:hypothetical protein